MQDQLAMRILKAIYASVFVHLSKTFSRKGLEEFLIHAIDGHCRQGLRIVSVGAGGEIGRTIRSREMELIEVDIDAARQPDIVLDLEDMHAFKDESIDVLFCMEVLEHVRNPMRAVSEIFRTLKPGGVLVGSTPFVFPIHEEPHDYFRYTEYGLSHLFASFEKLELRGRNSYLESVIVVCLRLLSVGSARQRIGAVVASPFLFTASLCLLAAGPLLSSTHSTTGYVYRFRKPPGTGRSVSGPGE